MKKIIIVNLLLLSGIVFSQVIIGGTTGTAPSTNKAAVLLEFEAGIKKGIILPYTRILPSGTGLVGGTILVDAATASAAKVKYYAPGNSRADGVGWVDLSSGNTADISAALTKQPTSTGSNSVPEDPNAKAIIGSNSTAANGVMVLESNSKVLVLPQVSNTDEVKSPAPGMMVYLKGTATNPNKRLAVFNGAKWTFWAPTP